MDDGARGVDRAAAEAQVLAQLRRDLLGGRCIFAMTGSAPISEELRAWVEELTGQHVLNGYGSTEAGMVLFDGEVQRPPAHAGQHTTEVLADWLGADDDEVAKLRAGGAVV